MTSRQKLLALAAVLAVASAVLLLGGGGEGGDTPTPIAVDPATETQPETGETTPGGSTPLRGEPGASTTADPATTTAPPETTPAEQAVEIEGAGEALTALIEDLYRIPEGGKAPAGREAVFTAFGEATAPEFPLTGRASVAAWSEKVRLGVVQVGEDTTLVMADPDWRVVGGWWPSVGVGQQLGSFPKIVAVVGSDARPDEDREATRTDSIHLVGLDGAGHAGLVGVPRDSWVPIPGHGSSKINAALAFGGPGLMMETFTQVTDLEYDGYLLTGFAGFGELVEALGGVEVDVPHEFDDDGAKAYFGAGRQVLDAGDALAFARTRKTLPRGDFDRQFNGGVLLASAQMMVRSQGPLALPQLLSKGRPHFSTSLGPEKLLILAAASIRVNPENVENTVAPGRIGTAGSASVVYLNQPEASEMFADLADGRLGD